MPSRSRFRKSSSSHVRDSFKSGSILEHGGQPPLQDNTTDHGGIGLVRIPPSKSQRLPLPIQTGSESSPVAHGNDLSPSADSAPSPSVDDDPEDTYTEGASAGVRIDPTVSAQRERLPRKRFGLHTDQLRAAAPQAGLPKDYKQKYPEDPVYRETVSNARIWHVYNDESQIFDNEIVVEAGDNLDILLVFAGLFASVLTTFVVQTSQSLSPDKTDISNSLLREMISLQRAAENGTSFDSIPAADTSFTVSLNDVWINSLWFVSLALSLSTALLAVIAKQWLRQYSSFISGTPRERALIRQFRFNGLEQWGVRLIIGLLPTVLHISLFLFLAGLVIFLLPLNDILARTIAGIAVFLCATYTITNFLPVIFIQCPYRTPLSEILNTLYGYAKFALMILRASVVIVPWILVDIPWVSIIELLEYGGVIDDCNAWVPVWLGRALEKWILFTVGWPKPLKDVERARADDRDKWGQPLGISGALLWLAQTTSDISAKAIIAEAVGSVSQSSLLTSKRTSIDDTLEQQWSNGEVFVEEDERRIERLMRGALMINSTRFWRMYGGGGPVHCQAPTSMLMNTISTRHSRFLMEDGQWKDLTLDTMFKFIAERRDLSAELESPVWMWWLLFIHTAGVTDQWWSERSDSLMLICSTGGPPDVDIHKEEWLNQVNIPSALQQIVRESMIDAYISGTDIQRPVSPRTLSEVSKIFVTQAHESKRPLSPFSTISLAAFFFANFSQFTGVWIGNVPV